MKSQLSFLSCRAASFGYDGRVVVSGLDWEIDEGDYLCIVGENGSGKSTLVKGILRLLQPMEGTIAFCEALRRNEIGYLSQQTAAQKDFPAGVYEIVLSGNLGSAGLRPFYSAAEKKITDENMERLGISAFRNCCFRELSIGQQRRVLLARSLCAAKKALVLDEPAAGLDPLVSADVYSLLAAINSDLKLTIIMVTHDIGAAMRYANKILHLKNKQVFFGTSANYRSSATGALFINSEKEAAGV